MPNVAYRVEGFPGLAFMIKKTIYTQFMQGKMEICCANRLGFTIQFDDKQIIASFSRNNFLILLGHGTVGLLLKN